MLLHASNSTAMGRLLHIPQANLTMLLLGRPNLLGEGLESSQGLAVFLLPVIQNRHDAATNLTRMFSPALDLAVPPQLPLLLFMSVASPPQGGERRAVTAWGTVPRGMGRKHTVGNLL